jgi:hypothetical protein
MLKGNWVQAPAQRQEPGTTAWSARRANETRLAPVSRARSYRFRTKLGTRGTRVDLCHPMSAKVRLSGWMYAVTGRRVVDHLHHRAIRKCLRTMQHALWANASIEVPAAELRESDCEDVDRVATHFGGQLKERLDFIFTDGACRAACPAGRCSCMRPHRQKSI